jgi:hypothetical protein
MATTRKPKRKTLTKALQKRLIMEAQSCCPWCEKPMQHDEVEFHHIDEDRSNNSFENLILVCRNHHGQITSKAIPLWDVVLKKQILCNRNEMERLGFLKPAPTRPAPSGPKIGRDNNGIAANEVHVENLHLHRDKKAGRREITPGLIEADPDMRTYATYLVKKYIAWRKKGSIVDSRKFNPRSAHGILGKGYGSTDSVLLITQARFHRWVTDAQKKIDGTSFGRINKGKKIRNYHSWEEHLQQRHGTTSHD